MAIIENRPSKKKMGENRSFSNKFQLREQRATNEVSAFSVHTMGKTTMPYLESSPGLRSKAAAVGPGSFHCPAHLHP